MTIDLQRFCATDLDSRTYLRSPFLRDGWVYATNGAICIRMRAEAVAESYAPHDHVPSVKTMFEQWIAPSALPYRELPPLLPLLACEACKCRGRFKVSECPDCDGKGEFTHGCHQYECQNCTPGPQPPGWVRDANSSHELTCQYCYGRGWSDLGEPQLVDDVMFERGYLHWLSKLPKVAVRVNGLANPMSVTFESGQGLLMPRRR